MTDDGFTTKEILLRFEEDTKSDLLRLETKLDAVVADHEGRIRGLERLKNAIPSVSVLSLVVSIASAAFIVFR